MRALHGYNVRSRRLDSVVLQVLLCCATIALCIAGLAFVATRSHMFHLAYTKRKQMLENNVWLLQQCKSSDFYSNMKHHSTLCDDVALEEADALWLHALRDVIDSTRICGEHACANVLQYALEWILGRGLLTFGGAVFVLFVLFTLAVQMQRVCASGTHDVNYAALHSHSPYSARGAHWYPLLTHTCSDYSEHFHAN